MLNWLGHLVFSVAVFFGLAQQTQPVAPVAEPAPIVQVATSTEQSEPAIDWKCRVVLGCKWADWRYANPEDECTYTTKIITAVNNPVENSSYGGWCTPYVPEEEKVRYEPAPPVIEPSVASPAPALTPALPQEPRYYTNELGQITTEDGRVLWSPAPKVSTPQPTTTPTEEIACGYEEAAGLPLGSKCPVSTDPFPCYPNQPWTCRPTAAQQSGHKCTLTDRSGATYQEWCAN